MGWRTEGHHRIPRPATTKVTDRGIDAIKDMTTLKLLDVMDAKVTNAAT